MSNAPLITNARVVNEGTVTEGDLMVRDGRIAGINQAAPEAPKPSTRPAPGCRPA